MARCRDCSTPLFGETRCAECGLVQTRTLPLRLLLLGGGALPALLLFAVGAGAVASVRWDDEGPSRPAVLGLFGLALGVAVARSFRVSIAVRPLVGFAGLLGGILVGKALPGI